MGQIELTTRGPAEMESDPAQKADGWLLLLQLAAGETAAAAVATAASAAAV